MSSKKKFENQTARPGFRPYLFLDSKYTYLILAGLFLFCAGAYVHVAWLTSAGDSWHIFDFVDYFKIFGLDDAYRYYSARGAWSNLSLFSWSYIHPGALILDGALSAATGGNLFAMRCLHAVAAFVSLGFLYRAGRALGINGSLTLIALLIVAAMPVYMLVVMSFFGESWLTIFFSVAVWAFVTERHRTCAALAACLPMIRPEGLVFMLPLAAYYLKEKQYQNLFICFLPGTLYFFYLLMTLGDLATYARWRSVARLILINALPEADRYKPQFLFSTFNLVWLLTCLLALLHARGRKLWPIWLGGCITWVILSAGVWGGASFYEARYYLAFIPVLAIFWACAADKFIRNERTPSGKVAAVASFLAASGLIVVEHLGQLDPVKASFMGGRRWPVAGAAAGLKNFDARVVKQELNARREAAEAVYELLQSEASVNYVVVIDHNIFYSLEPDRIPENVQVVYSPSSPELAYYYFGGSFFAMHPEGEQYMFLNFNTIIAGRSATAIVISKPFCNNCWTAYSSETIAVYHVSYSGSSEPQVMPSAAVRNKWTR